MKTNKLIATLLALVLTLPFAVACGKSVSETIDDATITTRVKTAFINDKEIRTPIDVDTFKGVVTLSGSVKTKAEETRAISLAKTIRGVVDVKSTLKVDGGA
jgi:hyperosmotically inducible periplasmic protein